MTARRPQGSRMALCRWSFSPEHSRGQLRSVSSVATWVQGEQRDKQSSSDGAETPAPGFPRGVGPAGSTAPLQTRTKPFLPLHHLPRASHQLCRPAPGIWPELDKYALNERNHHQGYMPTKASTQTLLDLEGPLPHISDLPGAHLGPELHPRPVLSSPVLQQREQVPPA